MLFLTLLFATCVAVSTASIISYMDPTLGYKDGDRYFYFPGDGDGVMHLVDTFESVDEDLIRNYARNPDNNAYWLYTRENPDTPQLLHFGDIISVNNSNINFKKGTAFIVHGWNGHGTNPMNTALLEAFLVSDDLNVIVLDWSRLANRNYLTAKRGVANVGKALGQFIIWLHELGLDYDNVHLVGFSLGGHLVGIAGREVAGKIKRITALDPAGPLWGSDNSRLVADDAVYVEVIHTTTSLGYSDPCGDTDFYPNGGSSMPGCWLNTCSHSRSWEYMASSVKNDHLLANECSTQKDVSRNRCSGEMFPMGNGKLEKGERSGIFRVNTARNYPF